MFLDGVELQRSVVCICMILRLSKCDQFVLSCGLPHLQHAKDAERSSERGSLNLFHLDVETWLVGFEIFVCRDAVNWWFA